jgi:hypothetical protein
MLPEGVGNVYLRSDAAGYQRDLLKHCEKGENKRFSKNAPVYRCVATRELLRQPELPGMEAELPFPATTMEEKRYKIFGIATNRDIDGGELVNRLHGRCGLRPHDGKELRADQG